MISPGSRFKTNRHNPPEQRAASGRSAELRLELLKLLLRGRVLDEALQALKRRGQISFQMSAAGHEALGAVGLAMKPVDWLHPHYRDRAIVLARGVALDELLLDYFGKLSGPSAGRQMPEHFNSPDHRIVSLSTPVATNFLQAVGMAAALKDRQLEEVVVVSTGDASSRQGEVFEAIAQAVVESLPVVFLFEDNGLGISTRTEGKTFWSIPHSLVQVGGQSYFLGARTEIVDGLDPVAVYDAAEAALETARKGAGPTCLVARCVRLSSHSSSDDQRIYRSAEELRECQARDPLPRYVERCLAEGLVTAEGVQRLKDQFNQEIDAGIERARVAPEPEAGGARSCAFAPLPSELPAVEQHLPQAQGKDAGGLTMAQCINVVLEQELKANARVNIFGEDIEDPKGDVFGITRGLTAKFPGRVKNSPLAEATIVGLAAGRAVIGDVPVATMQFIDFLGPGLNQLFNEIATFYWRSGGKWNCPVIILSPYGGYLPGLGPWHSQSNEALFAHVPGLNVVIPSNPADAAGLLRYALRCRQPVIYLYPKALLHGALDTVALPSPGALVPFGQARLVRAGRDITIVTWGNCVSLARAAAGQADAEGINAEIIDLRTIIPWDKQAVLESVARTGRLLVVHEDAKTCGFGAEIVAEVTARQFGRLRASPLRLTKTDDHNPCHYALELAILPSVAEILAALRSQCQEQLAAPALPAPQSVAASEPLAYVDEEEVPSEPPAQPQTASGHTVEVRVPRHSPTDEDAVLVRYLVKVGQQVQRGTPLVEMEANKGAFEVEAIAAGNVRELCARVGERVRVESQTVLRLESAEAQVAAPPRAKPSLKELTLSAAQLQVGAVALKSQREIPQVSTDNEVDLTALVQQRSALAAGFEARHGFRLTYTHLILWCLIRAMMEPEHERFRGRLSERGDKLIIEPRAHVGFAAVGPDEDLFSPAILDADELSFLQLVRRVQQITEKVRGGKLTAADLQGAQITLTNIGAYEVTIGTPFVIPGQLATLTAGSIQPGAGVVEREGRSTLEPRQIMQMKLVFDHRPLNGSHAARFMRSIKHKLEGLQLEPLISEK